jgi:hypothetical protein
MSGHPPAALLKPFTPAGKLPSFHHRGAKDALFNCLTDQGETPLTFSDRFPKVECNGVNNCFAAHTIHQQAALVKVSDIGYTN